MYIFMLSTSASLLSAQRWTKTPEEMARIGLSILYREKGEGRGGEGREGEQVTSCL